MANNTLEYELISIATGTDTQSHHSTLGSGDHKDQAYNWEYSTSGINLVNTKSYTPEKSSWPWPRSALTHARRTFQRRSWRFGLYTGFYACIVVCLSNIGLLFAGIFAYDGITDGVGTIAVGDSRRMARTSTGYHILINILSTILLTSSNYAMQILCAPTREEIDVAHRNGGWLEIGIASMHNLRHIKSKRTLLWALLAFTSAPLHLFYNSSVFEVSAGQDHNVFIVSDASESSTDRSDWKALQNSEWPHLYSQEWIPGYGDLEVILDRASFDIRLYKNWTYSLEIPSTSSMSSINPCDWTAVFLEGTSSVDVAVEYSHERNQTMAPQLNQHSRFVVNISELNNTVGAPELPWPEFARDVCPDSGWLLPNAVFHVKEARAKIIPYANRVQVAIPFLVVVIACNIAKIVGIYLTIQISSSGHIITAGDAIASFLQSAEPTTKGKCTLSKSELHVPLCQFESKPWCVLRQPMVILLGGSRRWSASIIVASFAGIAGTLTVVTSEKRAMTWGTASQLIASFTATTFDARGALLVSFVAKFPQVCLSLVYFSVNRICTSVCFATEWNDFARFRKGLRVTSPAGEQRDTHFLQLPFRWSIPLTITSGLLHWLMSQSLFLVRQERRYRSGAVYDDSVCACGYSVPSICAFSGVFFLLFLFVAYVILQKVKICVPPTGHCSLVISAACHPPADDDAPHLQKVQWGVIEEDTEQEIGHCTFTSQPVTSPEVGCLYK